MSTPSDPIDRRGAVRSIIVGTLVGIALTFAAGGSPVSAHTAFVGSTPADGQVVAAPVSEIVIEFTGVSEEAGDGFVVLDPTGQVREPSSVTTEDGKVFELAFDPPLSGGRVGVRWSVRAGDAHPIEGSFTFTVDDAVAAAPATTAMESADTSSSDMSAMSAAEMAAMDDFLQVDQSRPGESLARLGRLISIAAIVVAIGALAFLATTLRGSLAEIETLITAVRVLGVAIAVGALAEYVGVSKIAGDALISSWSSSAGAATALRAAGGVAIALGIVATTVPVRVRRRPRPLSAATASPSSELDVDFWNTSAARDPDAVRRWRPDRSSRLAFAGIGLTIISFWFDGHTVTEGFRPLHALANSVHVVAGSVWVGGVLTMTAVLWLRHRRHQPTGALELVVRFSSVAGVALGAVVVAGLVMAVSILDSVGEVTSTEWGQTFLLKSVAAGIAMLIGAYNHFRLIPALERDPHDAALHQSVRSTVTAEAIILAFVVVVTAWLVAAAS